MWLLIFIFQQHRVAQVHLQGPSVETTKDVGGEELNTVSGGSPAELVDVSGADPEVTRMCGEPLFPKSSCPFELIPWAGLAG